MSFWNSRFSSGEYIYGENPNLFFKEELKKIYPGTLLLPGEGEGRNAVYARKLGWKVIAFDSSSEAGKKAKSLARKNNVSFEYQIKTFEEFDYKYEFFDCIGLIFAHVNKDKRHHFHNSILKYLKPGGTVILVGFSKNQLNFNSGGPKDIDMLFSVDELKLDFLSVSDLKLEEVEVNLDEGNHHNGTASLITLVGVK